MTSREIVTAALRFQNPQRLPFDLGPDYGSDFFWTGMYPNVDSRPEGVSATDEWGCVWENMGNTKLGEVKQYPLANYADFEKLTIPDIHDPARWEKIEKDIAQAGEKFILGVGITLYERVHYLRGLENTWCDIHQHPVELCRLIDMLVDMNLVTIEKYAAAGVNGYFFCDDWGLQDRLMISPDKWREIWKPRYARLYAAAHDAGLLTFLHSCGDIVSILDDLIEIGLDVIQMDQQQNMGLEMLGGRFGGRITFMSPVDIQNMMIRGTPDEIRAYARHMVKALGRAEGGFIAQMYGDPKSAGHSQQAVDAMCREFLSIAGAES